MSSIRLGDEAPNFTARSTEDEINLTYELALEVIQFLFRYYEIDKNEM